MSGVGLFTKINNVFNLWSIFLKKALSWMFDWILNLPLSLAILAIIFIFCSVLFFVCSEVLLFHARHPFSSLTHTLSVNSRTKFTILLLYPWSSFFPNKNNSECTTSEIHFSVNTVSKYRLKNNCTLRPVTRRKSFIRNGLSLKLDCGTLCW